MPMRRNPQRCCGDLGVGNDERRPRPATSPTGGEIYRHAGVSPPRLQVDAAGSAHASPRRPDIQVAGLESLEVLRRVRGGAPMNAPPNVRIPTEIVTTLPAVPSGGGLVAAIAAVMNEVHVV